MKRRPTQAPPSIPQHISRFLQGATFWESSSSPQARVFFAQKGGGYFLKQASAGSLAQEAQMTRFFHSKGLAAQVLEYTSEQHDWLLTAALDGEDGVFEKYLEQPKLLCDTFAHQLRQLHETPFDGCPVADKTARYIATAQHNFRTDNFDKSHFPDNFGYQSAQQAWAALQEGKDKLQDKVLLHGDYCLPNIVLNNWKFSGFVDVGDGGVGDRHIDLFWGVWSLWFNLKTDAFRNRFLDAYGRDKVSEQLLDVVAAAEVFL